MQVQPLGDLYSWMFVVVFMGRGLLSIQAKVSLRPSRRRRRLWESPVRPKSRLKLSRRRGSRVSVGLSASGYFSSLSKPCINVRLCSPTAGEAKNETADGSAAVGSALGMLTSLTSVVQSTVSRNILLFFLFCRSMKKKFSLIIRLFMM